MLQKIYENGQQWKAAKKEKGEGFYFLEGFLLTCVYRKHSFEMNTFL